MTESCESGLGVRVNLTGSCPNCINVNLDIACIASAACFIVLVRVMRLMRVTLPNLVEIGQKVAEISNFY